MTTAKRCYIHVGLPKTGTSYLQGIFNHSREELAAQGLDLLPGTRRGTHHVTLKIRNELRRDIDPPRAFSSVRRMKAKANRAPGDRALFSHEVLGGSSPRVLQRLMNAFPGYEIHFIVTVRDQAGALTSAWQQHVKGRGLTPMDEFFRGFVSGNDKSPGRQRRHVIDRVLDTCSSLVPPERIHIITVPKKEAGPHVLLERYCEVLSVDPSRLRTDAPSANTSIGVAQAELLRRVNVSLGDRLPHRRAGYAEQGKRFLARQVLRPQGGRSAKLPAEMLEWFERSADQVIARLKDGEFDLVGDLEDLRPTTSAFQAEPQPVEDEELVGAAVTALADVLVDRAARSKRIARLEAEVSRQKNRIAQQKLQIAELQEATRLRAIPGRAARRLQREVAARRSH